MLKFDLIAICPHTGARRGRLHTKRGIIDTPCFMPVGTQGTVKGLTSADLIGMGYQQVLSNTYHLGLRPGSELIQKLGGIHKFMNWPGAILTDSGGYQVMSLSDRRTINDTGVTFRSHLDGSDMHLTPERSIQIQNELGVDIAMCLDECPPFPCSKDDAAAAMNRTHLWASRNFGERTEGEAIFGIVQGGVHEDLRAESAAFISSMEFDGVAIGGVSVGEPTEMQYPVVKFTAPLLPKEKPRYLMGVGHPKDILNAVSCGVDFFDCVLPTRMARHHCLYTLQGRINALNAKWADFDGYHDPESVCPGNEGYSAAYMRHLFKAKEQLGSRLASMHNLWFYARMMQEIRQAIENGTWPELMKRYQSA